MTNISEIEIDDLPSLSKLYEEFWGEKSSVEKMKRVFVRVTSNDSYHLLGAKRDGKLIGTVLGVMCESLYGECQPFMVVEDVVVLPDARRQGVGTLLMRSLEEKAAKRGCCNVLFVTESNRTDAIEFYESLGYRGEGHVGFKKYLKHEANSRC